jgi:hypothetical protein
MSQGDFRLPPDVIRKLGNGDAGAGYASICNALGFHPMTADPGTVPDYMVEAIGDGDPVTGRRVLQQFVAKVRQQRATPLRIPGRPSFESLPGARAHMQRNRIYHDQQEASNAG